MPVPGEELVITGKNFIQVDEVKIGDKVVNVEDFTVDEAGENITVAFKEYMKPGREATPVLSVTTGGGGATVENFYNYSTVLYDYDEATSNIINADWGGAAVPTSIETANPFTAPYTSDGNFAHWKLGEGQEGNQWWSLHQVYLVDWNGTPFTLPDYDVIPADAPASKVYLAIEVYNNNSDYNIVENYAGYPQYQLDGVTWDNQYAEPNNWIDYDNNIANFKQLRWADIDGKAPTGKWYRHVLALENFDSMAGKTYKQIKEEVTIKQVLFVHRNPGTVGVNNLDIALDNVRIIYIP